VEGVVDNDDVPPGLGLARELDRGLIRLGARVAEVDLAAEARLREALGEQHGGLGVEQVARVHQASDLLAHGLNDPRVAVTEARHRDAAQEVEVLVALAIPHARALAAHKLDRKARVAGDHARALELLQL
jgi:hypothetical protein